MNPTLARLTVLDNGVIRVSLAHDDGTGPQVMTTPDGTVQTLEVDEDGSRVLTIRSASDEIEAVRFVEHGPLLAADEQRSFGGPFVERSRPITLPDGREGTVTISKDASGHEWRSGKVPQSIDKSGYGSAARTWVLTIHPPNDRLHPSSHRGGESVELGRDRYTRKNGEHIDSNYTVVRTHERDAMGRDTSVSVRSAYSPDTGRQEHSSVVRTDDGTRSWTNVSRGQDGSWSMVTVTVDKDGHGTKHTTEGKGDQVTRDETTDADPSDAGPDKGEDGDSGSDPDPDPDSSSAPTGDGEQTSEGNPDGGLPFDAVELARLLGDDWDLGDGIDTLGDLDRALRPWIDQIIAAARRGGGGYRTGRGARRARGTAAYRVRSDRLRAGRVRRPRLAGSSPPHLRLPGRDRRHRRRRRAHRRVVALRHRHRRARAHRPRLLVRSVDREPGTRSLGHHLTGEELWSFPPSRSRSNPHPRTPMFGGRFKPLDNNMGPPPFRSSPRRATPGRAGMEHRGPGLSGP